MYREKHSFSVPVRRKYFLKSLQFYKPGMSFLRSWKLSLWNMTIKKDTTIIFQSLSKDRGLTEWCRLANSSGITIGKHTANWVIIQGSRYIPLIHPPPQFSTFLYFAVAHSSSLKYFPALFTIELSSILSLVSFLCYNSHIQSLPCVTICWYAFGDK